MTRGDAMTSLNELSATEIAEASRREITAEAVVRDCLERIAAREPTCQGLGQPRSRLGARAGARARPRAAAAGRCTACRSASRTSSTPPTCRPRWARRSIRGHRPLADAACVALLRAAGAVILGKTVTANSPAWRRRDRNPHNPAHTPGGSSSGSAAAVADYMVPAALGTQTGGSVLRPPPTAASSATSRPSI